MGGVVIDPIKDEVNVISDDFQSSTGIKVSKNTRYLIAETISSIIEDPHPAWQLAGGQREVVAQAYIEALPVYLYGIWKEGPIGGPITSFQFLHWLSNNLAAGLCVIRKP